MDIRRIDLLKTQNDGEDRDILTIPVKIVLFISSYIPLYLIVILLNHQNGTVFWFFLILSIVLMILFFIIYFVMVNTSGDYLKIDKVENVNKINVEYLVTYLLPFLNVNFNDIYYTISILIIFFVIGFIYVNSDMLYTNPTLNLFGFSIFKCQAGSEEIVVITRKGKNQMRKSEVVQIGSDIYMGK
jgi:phosphoglycerol transferase MdoB-like AlkP superfamily enzyme